MINKSVSSWNVYIHMAGDIALAGQVIQRHVITVPMCVTLAPQSFIYTGGREEGFVVGLIHYPRFPVEDCCEITQKACGLAAVLMEELGQHSYCVVTPETTTWVSRREQGK